MANINFGGIWKLLTEHDTIKEGGCMMCEYRKVRESGNQCEGCPIIYNSAAKKGEDSRVGITKTIEKLFNIEKSFNIGKHHAFFFSYYPELNFKFPKKPSLDILGNIDRSQIIFEKEKKQLASIGRYRQLLWIGHHINLDSMDDRKENLGMLLSTEHGYLHKAPLKEKEKELFINIIKQRNFELFGKEYWG